MSKFQKLKEIQANVENIENERKTNWEYFTRRCNVNGERSHTGTGVNETVYANHQNTSGKDIYIQTLYVSAKFNPSIRFAAEKLFDCTSGNFKVGSSTTNDDTGFIEGKTYYNCDIVSLNTSFIPTDSSTSLQGWYGFTIPINLKVEADQFFKIKLSADILTTTTVSFQVFFCQLK